MIRKKKNYQIIIGAFIGLFLSATVIFAATTYNSATIYYNNANSSLSATTVQDAVTELTGKCKVWTGSIKPGDYITYTPPTGTQTITTTQTGYTVNQSVVPRELTTWRVVDVKSDGTIDIISNGTSSNCLFFKGINGYKQFISTLNSIASFYRVSSLTTSSRYFGYNGQTQRLTSNTMFVYPASYQCVTGVGTCANCESEGCGDSLFWRDAKLVESALGTLTSSDGRSYWIASRYYQWLNQYTYEWFGRTIAGGQIANGGGMYYHSNSPSISFYDAYSCGYLRPIVTLKSGLTFSGSGTSAQPWTIQ